MKKERLTTPIGEAKWAHVQQPKPAFTDDKGRTNGEPKYQIDVVFAADDPEWKVWGGKVMAQIKALPDQKNKTTGAIIPKQIPIKKEIDENEQPTGRFFVTFKTGALFKPGLFDKFGRPLDEKTLVGNGSKVRVNYCENIYDAFGGGMNFYLNAVQVVELVEFKPQTAEAYGFTVEKAPEGEEPPFSMMGKPNTNAPTEPTQTESDDVPF